MVWIKKIKIMKSIKQTTSYVKLFILNNLSEHNTRFLSKRWLLDLNQCEHVSTIVFHFTYFTHRLQCWHIAIYKRIALFFSPILMNWKHWQFDLAPRIFQTLWFHGEYHTRANQITVKKKRWYENWRIFC